MGLGHFSIGEAEFVTLYWPESELGFIRGIGSGRDVHYPDAQFRQPSIIINEYILIYTPPQQNLYYD